MGPCVEERWTAGRPKIPGLVNGVPCLSPGQEVQEEQAVNGSK